MYKLHCGGLDDQLHKQWQPLLTNPQTEVLRKYINRDIEAFSTCVTLLLTSLLISDERGQTAKSAVYFTLMMQQAVVLPAS